MLACSRITQPESPVSGPVCDLEDMETTTARSVLFGPYSLDLRSGELRKHGTKLKMGEQPFQVLVMLLEGPGELVTREQLRARLWPEDTFVDFDHGLNSAVQRLRDCLCDSAEKPRWIETVPRRGYRFIGPIEGVPAALTRPAEDAPGPEKQPSAVNVRSRLWPRAGWLAATAAVAGMLATGGYLYFHRVPALTEKDPIIIADFTNTTGDSVFDGTLRQGLFVQMEQSPFFNILSGDQIAEQIRLMEKPPDTRLTGDVAREVCEHLNAKAEIGGSIAALDNQYVLDLSAVNCHTGETLAEEQVTAVGKTRLLAALGEAASKLRSKLGESRASLRAYDVPLEQTTSSVDALQAFNRCEEEYWRGDYAVAVSFCQRTVSIDPNFGWAYGLLGILYLNLGDRTQELEVIRKGYSLRDRGSEGEKLGFMWAHYVYDTGELERALQVARQWTKTYPRDPRAFNALGTSYRVLGRYDEALVAHREVLHLNPAAVVVHGGLAGSDISLNRFDEARSTLEQARPRVQDASDFTANFGSLLYEIDFLQKNSAGMAEEASHFSAQQRFISEVRISGYRGQLSHSRLLLQGAIASATQANEKEALAGLEANSAVREALAGSFVEARRQAAEAITLRAPEDWDTEATAAFSLALAGDTRQAQSLAADLNRRQPDATFVQSIDLPAIRAVLALRQRSPAEAIEDLRVGSSYALTPQGMLAVYLRGEAYLSAGQGSEAAAEFQKVIDHRGLVRMQSVGPLSHLGLGRAYAMQGDAARAGAAYRDFLTLWKDADRNIPIIKQAKAEYAKLQ